MLALRFLDHWRAHATFRLASFLNPLDQIGFLEVTEGWRYARVLDRMSVSPCCAFSLYRKLRANYTGDAARVQRSTDSANHDLAFIHTTVDVAALLTHAGAASELLTTVYDQGSLALNFSAVTTARPRMVNAGTLDVTTRGVPTAVYDGTSDNMSGPTASVLGFTAGTSPAISCCAVVKWAGTGNYAFGLGEGDSNASWRWGSGTSTDIIVDNAPGTNRITLQAVDTTANERMYVAHKALNATVAGYGCRQDGLDLTNVLALTGPGAVLSLSGTSAARWMAVSNSAGSPAGFAPGRSNFLALFNADLSAGDILTIEQEMARHL